MRARRPGLRSFGVLLGLAGIGLAGFGLARLVRPTDERLRPNVVLLSIDTLRADRLGSYGNPRDTSPTIDRLARDGALFTHAMAQRGMTWPSLASIMTGQYPVSHGVRVNGDMLDADIPSLARTLRQDGYATAAFLANSWNQRWSGFDLIRHGEDNQITAMALEWLQEKRRQPVFLWVHYFAPHRPYAPPAPFDDNHFDPDYRGTIDGSSETLNRVTLDKTDLSARDLDHVLALYDAEIAYDDQLVGRVVQALDRLGTLDETLLILTSDHGEELYDRNHYFYHGASIYEGVLRIPLILRLPGTVRPATRIDTIVESIDIAPTILDLVGLAPPPTMQGSSLTPLLRGRKLDLGPAYAERGGEILSIRTERHHYIFNPTQFHPPMLNERDVAGHDGNPNLPVAREELYDVLLDPREADNLVEAAPEMAARLAERLAQWAVDHEWTLGERELPQIPPEVRERLTALGYVAE